MASLGGLDGFAEIRTTPEGRAWLARLPALVEGCAREWELELGPPFEPLSVSYVAPATRADGSAAVLKVTMPEPESEHEAAALRLWQGGGAVRLLADDPARSALLLERLEPGTPLWEVGDEDEANVIAAGVLRRLWRAPPPGHPFEALADRAKPWLDEIPARWQAHGRPLEGRLVDEAVATLRELLATQGEQVVVHQDLHGGNVLAAAREPWLAIDPKPLVGEREFDTASLLRDRRGQLVRDPSPQRRVRRRLDLLAAELGLDRERMRGWGIAHALAWGLTDEQVFPELLACAGWLLRS